MCSLKHRKVRVTANTGPLPKMWGGPAWFRRLCCDWLLMAHYRQLVYKSSAVAEKPRALRVVDIFLSHSKLHCWVGRKFLLVGYYKYDVSYTVSEMLNVK